MSNVYERISDSELEVMNVLWDSGRALTMAELRRLVGERTGWESSTVKTLVQRLCTKGAVSQQKREVYYYTPCISRADYGGYAARSLVDRLYHGSARDLVAALVGTGLSRQELAELRTLLEEETDV